VSAAIVLASVFIQLPLKASFVVLQCQPRSFALLAEVALMERVQFLLLLFQPLLVVLYGGVFQAVLHRVIAFLSSAIISQWEKPRHTQRKPLQTPKKPQQRQKKPEQSRTQPLQYGPQPPQQQKKLAHLSL